MAMMNNAFNFKAVMRIIKLFLSTQKSSDICGCSANGSLFKMKKNIRQGDVTYTLVQNLMNQIATDLVLKEIR